MYIFLHVFDKVIKVEFLVQIMKMEKQLHPCFPYLVNYMTKQRFYLYFDNLWYSTEIHWLQGTGTLRQNRLPRISYEYVCQGDVSAWIIQ